MNYCCVCCHKLHKTYMINMSCYPYKIIQVLLENRWQCVQIDVAPPKGGPPPPAGNPLNRGKKGGCWVGAIRPPPPDCFYTGRAQPYSYAMSGIVRNSKSGGVGRCAHPDRFATPPRQPRRVWEWNAGLDPPAQIGEFRRGWEIITNREDNPLFPLFYSRYPLWSTPTYVLKSQ